jgi:hypothetical protein
MQRTTLLRELCEQFLSAVLNSVDDFPIPFREALMLLREQFCLRFVTVSTDATPPPMMGSHAFHPAAEVSSDSVELFLTQYLFQVLMLPFLRAPAKYDLCPLWMHDVKATANIGVVVDVLDRLLSGVLFPEDNLLRHLNAFLMGAKSGPKEFFAKLVHDTADASTPSSSVLATTCTDTSVTVDAASQPPACLTELDACVLYSTLNALHLTGKIVDDPTLQVLHNIGDIPNERQWTEISADLHERIHLIAGAHQSAAEFAHQVQLGSPCITRVLVKQST